MSFDSMLIHTCTIENPASGALNVYNNASKVYAAPLTGVRCRLVEDKEMVEADEKTEGFIKTTYSLLVGGSVDLQEKAKISSVTFEDGTTISDVFVVRDVLHRRGRNSHHKTAMLERIS